MAKSRKRQVRGHRQLGAIERDILSDLSGGDLLYGFLLSARSSGRMMRLARERANHRYRRKLALGRLLERNFVRRHGNKLLITNIGRDSLGEAVEKTRDKLETAAWDGKWRIVAFDIPEQYAAHRDTIRRILKKAGFVLLQRSVWIFPHECKELADMLKAHSQLSKHILYGVLEKFEGEIRLKKAFHL